MAPRPDRPAQQRLAQRPGVPLATVSLGDVHRRQPRPPGAVGRRRDGRHARRHASATAREHHFAVDDRGQARRRERRAHRCAATASSGRSPRDRRHRRCRAGASVVSSVVMTTFSPSVGTPRWHPEQPVGNGEQRRRAAGRVPVDDRGHGAQVAADLKRHRRIRSPGTAVAVPQQPAVEPLLLDARPGQRGGVLEVADVAGAHGRVGQRLDRDHVGRGDVDHVATLGAHPQRRTHLEQMADDVGQRRHGTGGQAVPQADPGADRRTDRASPAQWPNGIGILAGHPGQTRHAPAVGLDAALRRPRMPADQAVEVEEPVEVSGLVLQHAREQSGALERDRGAVGVEARDPRPVGPARRERLAGHRQTTLVVVVGIGHGLRNLGGLQHRVDDDAAATGGAAPLVGAVVDEHPLRYADLVGGQADSVGGIHRVVQIGDQTRRAPPAANRRRRRARDWSRCAGRDLPRCGWVRRPCGEISEQA